MTVSCLLLTTFRDELFYRSYLVSHLRNWGVSQTWTVLLTSALFGINGLSYGLPSVCLITVHGAMFAFAFLKTKSMWPLYFAHFTYAICLAFSS
jgi:membrane protease YdiL (CAAX protease family)